MSKILLVEDDAENVNIMVRLLKTRGYTVVVAGTGAEAIAKANAEPPDLILMDMKLPGMDGWEATRQLKGSPVTAAIPVLALTAHAMMGDKEKAVEAGCDDYDTKPIDFIRLCGKIKALLQRT